MSNFLGIESPGWQTARTQRARALSQSDQLRVGLNNQFPAGKGVSSTGEPFFRHPLWLKIVPESRTNIPPLRQTAEVAFLGAQVKIKSQVYGHRVAQVVFGQRLEI